MRGSWLRHCCVCTHRFFELTPASAHAESVYGDSYFFGGGAGYRDYFRESTLVEARGLRYADIIARYAPAGTMLDAGAAAGFISAAFRSRGWQPIALDPNRGMTAFAHEWLGLEACTGTLETFDSPVPFDLVTMIQVVAHFYDLQAAFSAAARMFAKGGLLLVETWDSASLTARLLGRFWHEYNPPSVLHCFTRASLELLASRHGLEGVASGRLTKYIQWEHARSLLVHQTGSSALDRLLKLVPDRTVVPYPSEDLFWALFRRRGAGPEK